jgi:hypothetical protein
MKTQRNLSLAAAAAAALTLALVGCGGGGNDDPAPVATEVPDSSGASTAAFVAFILALGGDNETSEPLTIRDTLATPADESAEPTPLT